MESFTNFLSFPPEIILKIFSNLTPTDLKNVFQVSALFPFAYETQKLRMKNLRFVGFENQNNRRYTNIKEITRQMNDDIVTVNDEGLIKIYDLNEFKIKNEIHTGINLDLNGFARDHIYMDENSGVIVLRKSIWETQNTGHDEITIVETKPQAVVHKNLKHSVMVDMKKCVAVVEDHVVIGDANGELKIWERVSGECVAILHHNLFLHSVIAGEDFFITADIYSIKYWTSRNADGSNFSAGKLRLRKEEWEKRQTAENRIVTLGVGDEDFRSKDEEWVWRPDVEDHIALVRVGGDVIAAMLTGPRGYRIIVLDKLGKLLNCIPTGQVFYLNCNAHNTFLSGGFLVLTFHSGICQVWDLKKGKKVFEVENIPFREGCVAVAGKANIPFREGCVAVAGKENILFRGGSVAVAGKEQVLVTCNADMTIELWSLRNGVKVNVPAQKPLEREDLEIVENISKIQARTMLL